MVLNQEKGGYALGPQVRLFGAFRINGTSDPDTLRDGGSHIVSVARVSAGLFRVTLDTGFPIPEIPVKMTAELEQAATPTNFCKAYVVRDTYSQANRQFDIQVRTCAANAASDADDNDIVCFELVGSISSAGTDPA